MTSTVLTLLSQPSSEAGFGISVEFWSKKLGTTSWRKKADHQKGYPTSKIGIISGKSVSKFYFKI